MFVRRSRWPQNGLREIQNPQALLVLVRQSHQRRRVRRSHRALLVLLRRNHQQRVHQSQRLHRAWHHQTRSHYQSLQQLLLVVASLVLVRRSHQQRVRRSHQ